MQDNVGKVVRSLMRQVRQTHFARPGPRPDPRTPVVYWEETSLNGVPYMVPLVVLRTRPCRWFSAGGCVMCNYELLAIDEGTSDTDVLLQAESAIRQLGPDLGRYPYLLLTSQGSFLDDEEVPPPLRDEVLRRFWEAGLRAISTESEARYCLDEERLFRMKESFPGRISIGIGLEAANDFIRNSVINKGLPLHMMVKAAATLKAQALGFYTYVSLGKPFLTPSEDVQDAVDAVRLSHDLGAFMSVLEMINIQPHTLTEQLWLVGRYMPCSLWNGLEVLARLPAEVRESTSVKGFDADVEPVPLALSCSCGKCDTRVRRALNDWNLYRDFDRLRASADNCECAPKFETCSSDFTGIAQRTATELAFLRNKEN